MCIGSGKYAVCVDVELSRHYWQMYSRGLWLIGGCVCRGSEGSGYCFGSWNVFRLCLLHCDHMADRYRNRWIAWQSLRKGLQCFY